MLGDAQGPAKSAPSWCSTRPASARLRVIFVLPLTYIVRVQSFVTWVRIIISFPASNELLRLLVTESKKRASYQCYSTIIHFYSFMRNEYSWLQRKQVTYEINILFLVTVTFLFIFLSVKTIADLSWKMSMGLINYSKHNYCDVKIMILDLYSSILMNIANTTKSPFPQ